MFLGLLLASSLGAPPALVAQSQRCNSVVASQLQAQLDDYAKHPPAAADLDARLGDLRNVLGAAESERQILHSVCPDKDYAAAASPLAVAEGWAYLLEADAAQAEYHAHCPVAEATVTAGFVAAAWYHAVDAAPDSGPIPASVTDLQKKVRARAATVNLTLPPFGNTTSYWLQTVQDAGAAAAKSCPQ